MKAEILNLGIDHEQYFPGVGTSFTPYRFAVVGIGDNYAEALDDAIDNLYQCCEGGDADAVLAHLKAERFILTKREQRRLNTVTKELREQYRAMSRKERREIGGWDGFTEGCELHYYVAIRWTTEVE